MKLFFRIFLSTIFYSLLLFVVITLLSSKFNVFGLHSYVVQTGSMEPTIRIGSVVYTYPAAQYNVNDIITFKRDTKMITHRIVEAKNNQFVVKGDANKVVDPSKVFQRDIVGKNIIILPYIGRFIEFIKTLPGFVLFIALPIIVYIAFEIRTVKKEIERLVEKKILEKQKLIQNHE